MGHFPTFPNFPFQPRSERTPSWDSNHMDNLCFTASQLLIVIVSAAFIHPFWDVLLGRLLFGMLWNEPQMATESCFTRIIQWFHTYLNKYPNKHPTYPTNDLALTTFMTIRHSLSQFELGTRTRSRGRKRWTRWIAGRWLALLGPLITKFDFRGTIRVFDGLEVLQPIFG